jgi:hypothetical protein
MPPTSFYKPLFHGLGARPRRFLPVDRNPTGFLMIDQDRCGVGVRESFKPFTDSRSTFVPTSSLRRESNGEVSHAAMCIYTMTSDEHFIIDAHPEYPQVGLAAGLSGHGFKFSSMVGEILSSSDIALFPGSCRGALSLHCGLLLRLNG